MGTSIPQVEDINNDGIKDIVTSDYFCNISFFEGEGNNSYKKAVPFKKSDGSDLIVPGAAHLTTVNDGGVYGAVHLNDWNEDGLFDILFMGDKFPLMVYYNEGEIGAPLFGDCDSILIGGNIHVNKRPSITVYDLNLDGKKDLIFGRDKYVSYSLNIGTNDSPVFDEMLDMPLNNGTIITMVSPTGGYDANPIHGEAQVTVGDWNNDGYPDLLVGENCGWTFDPPFEYLYLFLAVPGETENLKNNHGISKKSFHETITYNSLNKSMKFNNPINRDCRVGIYSTNGKLIKMFSLSESVNEINLNSYSSGSYILNVNMVNYNYVNKIIIK